MSAAWSSQLPVDLGNDGSPEERLYARDTCRILKIISKDCPRFDLPDNKIQMIPANRFDFRIQKANPLELYNPFGDLEFEVIDYGISFDPFLSADNSDDRQYLDKVLVRKHFFLFFALKPLLFMRLLCRIEIIQRNKQIQRDSQIVAYGYTWAFC